MDAYPDPYDAPEFEWDEYVARLLASPGFREEADAESPNTPLREVAETVLEAALGRIRGLVVRIPQMHDACERVCEDYERFDLRSAA